MFSFMVYYLLRNDDHCKGEDKMRLKKWVRIIDEFLKSTLIEEKLTKRLWIRFLTEGAKNENITRYIRKSYL